MRTLPAALTAAQRSRSRKPYLKVVISNRFPAVLAPIWETLYVSGGSGDPHAAAATTDGYLTRLTVQANILYRNRVDPDNSPAWATWTTWRTATRLCALARYGLNLSAFAVDNATPTQIYLAESTNGGATWSAFALAITHSSTITHIAAARKSNGDLCVIVNDGSNIAAYRRLSSVWQAKVVSTTTAMTLTGLALEYEADWNCLASGADASNAKLVRQIFGDGYSQAAATWSTPMTIVSAAVASNVSFHAPFKAYPDTHRATFRERYTGTGAYDRIMLTNMPFMTDFVNDMWREPTPFNLDQDYGLAIAFTNTQVYLTCTDRVYRASLTSASRDVTADVLAAAITETSLLPTISTIVLDNANGQYNTLGSGANAVIRKGARVQVSPGYDALSSKGPAMWIVGFRHDYPPDGRATLTILAGDAWHFLHRWGPPRTYFFPQTKNNFQLLNWLLARVGFESSSLGSSGVMSSLYPDFVLQPGYDPPPYISGWTLIKLYGLTPWGTPMIGTTRVPIWVDPPPLAASLELPDFPSALAAIRRLLTRCPDRLITRAGYVYIVWPQASDASVASYAWGHDPASQHEISAADYQDNLLQANHERVFGGALGDVLGEALDWAEIGLYYSAPRIHADPLLTTATQASDRAAAEQRHTTIEAMADHIVAPVHCGLEVLDVIDITDARHGLSAAKRRVRALTLHYQRGKSPVYDHVITLGQP